VTSRGSSRKRYPSGTVFLIRLGEGWIGYGWIVGGDVAFLDVRTREESLISAIQVTSYSIAFRLWVMDYAVRPGSSWTIIGAAIPSEEQARPVWRFKQDGITGQLYKTLDGSEEIAVSVELATAMECAAVWDPLHVEDRLRDHFAGRPCKWTGPPALGLDDWKAYQAEMKRKREETALERFREAEAKKAALAVAKKEAKQT
jgi:Immunity protein 26